MKSALAYHLCNAIDFHLEVGSEPGIIQQNCKAGFYSLSSCLYSYFSNLAGILITVFRPVKKKKSDPFELISYSEVACDSHHCNVIHFGFRFLLEFQLLKIQCIINCLVTYGIMRLRTRNDRKRTKCPVVSYPHHFHWLLYSKCSIAVLCSCLSEWSIIFWNPVFILSLGRRFTRKQQVKGFCLLFFSLLNNYISLWQPTIIM